MCWYLLGGSARINNPMVNAWHTFLGFHNPNHVIEQCKSIARLMVANTYASIEVRRFIRSDPRMNCLRMVLWKDVFHRVNLWQSITIYELKSSLRVERIDLSSYKINGGEVVSTAVMQTYIKNYLKNKLSCGEIHNLRCEQLKSDVPQRIISWLILEHLNKIK